MAKAKSSDTKYCMNCDKLIAGNAEKCPYCGTEQTLFGGKKNPVPKNPITAAILSLLFPGLGHLYIGDMAKGVILIFLNMILGFSVYVLTRIPQIIVWLYAIQDAYHTAARIRDGKMKGSHKHEQTSPPDPLKLP